jgi:hypothetical protein
MISKSTITLTQADMQTALTYWLNATAFKEPVKVVNVKRDDSNRFVGGIEHFVAEIERDDAPSEPQRKEPT